MIEAVTKSFDVLSRELKVHQHHILEASAGTGKTFSIENLVVRLLIESDEPLELSQILVMTFTRAATRELRQRVRENIQNAIEFLTSSEGSCPDFICAIKEQPQDVIDKAKRRLEVALGTYDEAQIFTIHGFCARVLRECQEGTLLPIDGREEQGLSDSLVRQLVRDVFRTEVLPNECSPGQLERLLNDFKGDDEKLQKSLASFALKAPIASVPSFCEHYRSFQAAIQLLQDKYACDIVGLYQRLGAAYKKYDDAATEKIERFAQIFEKDLTDERDLDQLIRDDCILPKALEASQRKKSGAKNAPWPTPEEEDFLEALRKHLLPIVGLASDVKRIFAWMARKCQDFIRRYVEEEGIAGADQILEQMAEAVDDESFRSRVALRYRFAIVDEFQDTDPIQWGILQKLFLQDSRVHMALVGDPKQAIYSFRRADVYTYMQAVSSFASEYHASLDTNFRSCTPLVEAVNYLFNEEDNPNLLIMPALDRCLSFRPALPAPRAQKSSIDDGRGAIHMFIARGKRSRSNVNWPTGDMKEAFVLPFLVQEITRLAEFGRSYRDIAILIRDRYEASDTLEFLRHHQIPAILERSGSITQSSALDAFLELLHAVLRPWDNAALFQLLGGGLLAFSQSTASEWSLQSRNISLVYSLRDILHHQGVSSFMQAFLLSRWTSDSMTVMETLLSRDGGVEVYRDLRHLTEILTEQHLPASGLIIALQELRLADDDERYYIRSDASQDAVRILTIHASKGLEYPIVFATGLKERSKTKDSLVPDHSGTGTLVIAEENGSAIESFLCEQDAEKIRLAYVAMTRAKERLYLPLLIEEDSKITQGQASPLELIVGGLGRAKMSRVALYECIKNLSDQSLIDFLNTKVPQCCISYEVLRNSPSICRNPILKIPPVLVAPPSVQVPGIPSWMHSFTSLSSHNQVEHEAISLDGCPREFNARIKNAHTLPAGSEVGVLVHEIMEKMPLEYIKATHSPEELLPFIQEYAASTPFSAWSSAIANVVFAGFKTPITLGSCHIPLCEISTDSSFREMEFLFAQAPDSFSSGEGFLKGFVDFVFSHEGSYYIVDWKTNWLGPDQDHYNIEALEAAMRRGSYALQANIYAEAMERYLRCFEERPFEECFGGIYYLFLRGMNPEIPNSGVVNINPVGVALCQE